jgi:hypothetical protein
MNSNALQAQPVLDFKAILNLEEDDTLDGYRLCLGGFIHIRLEEIEKAYLAADAAGLHGGTLVQFNYGSLDVGVVTGRNLSVMSQIGSPSRCPIEVHCGRGYFEYSVADVRPIQMQTAVVGLTKSADLVEGVITAVDVKKDDRGYTYATVTINEVEYSMRDFVTLEVAPTLH